MQCYKLPLYSVSSDGKYVSSDVNYYLKNCILSSMHWLICFLICSYFQTGYMFGKGVYFADMVSKSANYCRTSKGDPKGLMLLCEVALGNM